MSDSISGTAVQQPPKGFSIELYGRVGQQIEKRLATTRRAKELEDERKLRAARHQAKHEVEMLALEYARTMMLRDVHFAIELEKTDPALAAKLRERIMNRGIGKPAEADEDAAQRKKGPGADEVLNVLAAVSRRMLQTELGHDGSTAVPRDVTPGVIEYDDSVTIEDYLERQGAEGDDDE